MGKRGPLDRLMLKSWALGILLAALTLIGCGGGSSSSDTTTTTTTLTVGFVKKCLLAGGATSVSGGRLEAGEGQHVDIVKASGPSGGDIQIALYESPTEVQQAIVLFSSGNSDKSFKAAGRALIVLAQNPATKDRNLASRCAGGP